MKLIHLDQVRALNWLRDLFCGACLLLFFHSIGVF